MTFSSQVGLVPSLKCSRRNKIHSDTSANVHFKFHKNEHLPLPSDAKWLHAYNMFHKYSKKPRGKGRYPERNDNDLGEHLQMNISSAVPIKNSRLSDFFMK